MMRITAWQIQGRRTGKWYRGVLDAVERFMVRWNEEEGKESRQRHPRAMGGPQKGKGKRAAAV